jgi:hypothetical protein
MMIRIKTEREVVLGEQRVKILGIDALDYDSLPKRYLAGVPRCYKLDCYDNSLQVYLDEYWTLKLYYDFYCYTPVDFYTNYFQLLVGGSYNARFFDYGVVEVIKNCGERLWEINKQNEIANDLFHCKKTVRI